MAQGAGALPQSELGVAIDGGFRHQLDDGAAAIGRDRSLEERGRLIAAQPPLEKVIAGQGRTFPAVPQLTHVSIMTLVGAGWLGKMVGRSVSRGAKPGRVGKLSANGAGGAKRGKWGNW